MGQIKVLQKIAQERVSAEGMECLYRINQRSTIERLNEERRQVLLQPATTQLSALITHTHTHNHTHTHTHPDSNKLSELSEEGE